MTLKEILSKYRRIAVVGLSRDETKYSYLVSKFMQDAGYKIIPINPFAGELLREKAYKSLDDVDVDFDIVDVFRPSEEALEVTRKAVGKGAKVVWLQEGIMNDEAERYARSKGVEFVQNKCIMKEYLKLFGEDYGR